MLSVPTGRLNRVSPIRTMRLADHLLTYIPDGSVQLHPRAWFPESTSADWQERADHLDDEGCLVASIGGLLVQYEDRVLLIDVGYGPRRIPADRTAPALGLLEGGRLASSLAEVGVAPEAIDTIAFTHLHDDHVGWAFVRVRAGADLFFRNATLVSSAVEWRSQPVLADVASGLPTGRMVQAADGEEIFPGVTAWVTPGHTPGHTSYVISSGGRRLIAFGDALHSPCQIGRLHWPVSIDAAPTTAIHTRMAVVESLARPDTLGFGGHFADVVFGRIAPDGDGYRWEPVD